MGKEAAAKLFFFSHSDGSELWNGLSSLYSFLFNREIEQTQSRLYTTGDWEVFFTEQAGWQSLFKTWYQNQFTVETLPQQSATKNKGVLRSINHWQKERKYIAFINQMEQGKNEWTSLQIV